MSSADEYIDRSKEVGKGVIVIMRVIVYPVASKHELLHHTEDIT